MLRPYMLRHVRDVEREPVGDVDGEGEGISPDRYIINLRAQLAERPVTLQLGSSVNASGGLPSNRPRN